MEVVQIHGEYLCKEIGCFGSYQLDVPSMHSSAPASPTASFQVHFLWSTEVSTRICLWTIPFPQENYHCLFIFHGSKERMHTRNAKEVK